MSKLPASEEAWDRQVNEVLARKRSGLQICDLMGEDADEMDRMRDMGTPVDVVEYLLDGGKDE